MKLLDLYCGAGGAAKGYYQAGFEITGVDIKPQPRYPYNFIESDVLQLSSELLTEFDAIHASPPCQLFTAYRRKNETIGSLFDDLIEQTRVMLEETSKPYIIENVKDAPLNNPVVLCGSTFGLDIRRHRYFEHNFPLVGAPCNHKWQTPRFPPAANRDNLRSTVEVRCVEMQKVIS